MSDTLTSPVIDTYGHRFATWLLGGQRRTAEADENGGFLVPAPIAAVALDPSPTNRRRLDRYFHYLRRRKSGLPHRKRRL